VRGLFIKAPWIDMILDGRKTWEIRGSATSIRGRIALLRSGASRVAGVCDLLDCEGPLALDHLRANAQRAGFEADELPYKRTYAWILTNPVRLARPVPFEPKPGAVIWLQLAPGVAEAVAAQL
jgi:hypothetical protein